MVGAMFILILSQDVSIDVHDALIVLAASIASYLIGFFSPGVPGGIGVRESALLLMLSPRFPQEIVLTAAILQRFTMILGDVLAWVLGALLAKSQHGRNTA
jgi:uncharacterized membrane protein YbhN (UPF0104 family)